ncbi:MAG: DASS family sodium-coupled anion symporter [Verrucomicrobiota bacterium]
MKNALAVLLGICALATPFIFEIPGLWFPGAIGLGIFAIAAVFWITECVPIWATSLLIIFLQVVLLSDRSPLQTGGEIPSISLSNIQIAEGSDYSIPESAIDDSKVWINCEGSWQRIQVEATDTEGRYTLNSSSDSLLALNSKDWRLAYSPIKYTEFFSSLSSPIIMLFLGGFFLASGAVKYRLDQNINRVILGVVGKKPANVVLALMGVTAALSAFMSNTATTAMMITVVLPLMTSLPKGDKVRSALVLAIPCGANIGGLATPIGSPPNAVALGALAKAGVSISFSQWMLMMTPLAIGMILVTWRLLLWLFPTKSQELEVDLRGKWDRTPKALLTYLIFAVTVLLWMTDKIHGMSTAIVAFIPVTFMPLLGILDKNDIKTFSWEVLWLMAGGISLGITMKLGGAEWLVGLVNWSALGPILVIPILTIVAYILSNLISNTVSATILIPIAITMGTSGVVGEGFDTSLAALAIGVSVSFSMLLPISTPPNAIAMSSGAIDGKELIRVGAFVGAIGIVATLLMSFLVWGYFLE